MCLNKVTLVRTGFKSHNMGYYKGKCYGIKILSKIKLKTKLNAKPNPHDRDATLNKMMQRKESCG